eukprot:m.92109 g.92109  ORF g.92109 m.92109 type:complete len:83 (+) comp8634_c1_seq1:969-1217(+)
MVPNSGSLRHRLVSIMKSDRVIGCPGGMPGCLQPLPQLQGSKDSPMPDALSTTWHCVGLKSRPARVIRSLAQFGAHEQSSGM